MPQVLPPIKISTVPDYSSALNDILNKLLLVKKQEFSNPVVVECSVWRMDLKNGVWS